MTLKKKVQERDLVQRYTWEDSMIEAQRDGMLSNGALLTALKLARAINWTPTEAWRPGAGLYWANDAAFAFVGLGRSTYYRHATELRDAGFLEHVGNNLHPCLPTSTSETQAAQDATDESEVETQESKIESPFSEELFSDDSYSDDLLSEPPAKQGWKPGLPLISSLSTHSSSSSNSLMLEEW
jgi:hypothetical protein